MPNNRGSRIIGLIITGLAMAGLLGLVLGIVIMWLWNALMPGIFGLPQIGYWQAVGLFILAHLLLKGPGHRDYDHDEHRRRAATHPGEEIRTKVKTWLNGEKSQDVSGEEGQ